jgi:MinD-like ATPase involved in chromosome partitioning or flagellar assembly
MKVITFYSYKGGVGRTLAAANFAVYLAKLGLKTVIVDFDLEAPGIDAKFGLPILPEDQKGLLDYILAFQETNQERVSIREIILPVSLDSIKGNSLWLIPAGQYLSKSYYQKLNRLNWELIFSDKRDGVSFFQEFLFHLEQDLQTDFVIIDSRTGITEISSLCTQQLANEIIIMSSLSSESIRVTKHIKNLIENSEISRFLEKEVDIKIVISRIPKPENLLEFKQYCCTTFDISEEKLFFLFSCADLEKEEFLALNDKETDKELVINYVKLFTSLNLQLADDNIIVEIENTTRRLLLLTPEDAEKSVLDLVAMYYHPEVYRVAMRFFKLRDQESRTVMFALRLLEFLPDDDEAQINLGHYYLQSFKRYLTKDKDTILRYFENSIRVLELLHKKNKLNLEEIERYAEILLEAQEYNRGLKILLEVAENEEIEKKIRHDFYLMASQFARKLEYPESPYLTNELIEKADKLYPIKIPNFDIEENLDDIPF